MKKNDGNNWEQLLNFFVLFSMFFHRGAIAHDSVRLELASAVLRVAGAAIIAGAKKIIV